MLALLLPGFGWAAAASMYVLVVLAATIVLTAAPPARQPLAFVMATVAILVAMYALPAVEGLEWFAPVYFIKLLLAHLLAPPQVPPAPT